MISIQEIKQLVQSQEYQQLAQTLIQKHNLDVRAEDSIQGWNIDCEMLNPSGISLVQLYQHFVENAELIGVILAQRQQKSKDDSYFMPSVFLYISMDLLLLQDKNHLTDYFKKIKMPAPTKVAKEWQQEVQTALAILNGEQLPITPKPMAKKSAKKSPKITLGDFSVSEYFDDEKMTTAILWDKETRIFLTGDDKNIPIKKIEKQLGWIEESRDELINFALDAEDFMDNFNAWVEEEISKDGKAKLIDGTLLTQTVTKELIVASIFIDSVCIDLDDEMIESISIDLMTTPDYFGGHAFNVEVDSQKNLSFGGVNG